MLLIELFAVTGLLSATAAALWYLPRNKTKIWKISARIAAGLLICVSAVPLLLVFLVSSAMCGRYEFPPISSRDGKLAAQVSEEDCGAVDSFHSSVHVWQNREGFFARPFGKRVDSTTIFTVGHDPRLIDLSWKDGRTLLIRYPNDSRRTNEFWCQSRWEDIQIECVGFAPDYTKPVGNMPPVHRGLW